MSKTKRYNYVHLLMIFGAISLPSLASAQDDLLKITYSEAAEESFVEDYGVREKQAIESSIRRNINRQIGLSDKKIEIEVVNVTPNRPTLEQMSNRPGLCYCSFGRGGAQFIGRIYSHDGQLLNTIEHSWESLSLEDSYNGWEWNDAEYASYSFARKIARAIN